jgi:rod shape-determining protein MreC
MARGYSNRNAKSSLVFNISRPFRELMRRFSFGVLIFISIISVIAGKSENNLVVKIRTKVIDVLSPVMSSMSQPFHKLTDSGEQLQTYFFVHSKNASLETENKILRLQVARLAQSQKENEQLRQLLHYVNELEYQYITAKVIGNASGPFSHSSLIYAGADDAVMKGQAVVMDGGLVGRIVEVGHNSSRILLLTDINSKIPVISMDSREHCMLAGNNTENPKLLYLPKESKIAAGEYIMTSGDGNMIPPGLMVGRAVKLADGSYEVIPFVSSHHIEYVSVLGLKEDKNNIVDIKIKSNNR